MYEDRIEITSPGGLLQNITKENYINGDFSNLRNIIIAEVFHRLQIIEKFATGIRRIKNEYSQYVEKPKFKVETNYIQVILPKISYLNVDAERAFEMTFLSQIRKKK